MTGQTNRSRYLKLSIDKTFEDILNRSQPVPIQLKDSIDVIATIKTENIISCQISISYPKVYLELQNEPSTITLTPNLSSYERDICWRLKALKIISVPFWISIRATTDKLIQEAGFNAKVINNEQS